MYIYMYMHMYIYVYIYIDLTHRYFPRAEVLVKQHDTFKRVTPHKLRSHESHMRKSCHTKVYR